MRVTRPWAFCCVALALLLNGLSGFAAAGTRAAPDGPAPCHSAADTPSLHDADCALGCDTSPSPDSPSLHWAPAHERSGQDNDPLPGITASAWYLQLATTPVSFASPGPRAPPRLPGATPVARHDILRN